MNDEPVSPLRRRMIEDMKIRGFSEKTRSDYVRHVKAFAIFFGRSPHLAGPEGLRRYHLHLATSGVGAQRQPGVVPCQTADRRRRTRHRRP